MAMYGPDQITNVMQSMILDTIAMRAPEATVKGEVRGGMSAHTPNLDLDILARLNRPGIVDFGVLIDVTEEVGVEDFYDKVDIGVMSTIFNILQAEAQDATLLSQNPLKDLPELITSEENRANPISDSQDKYLKFGHALRERNTPLSPLEAAGIFGGDWNFQDIWGITHLIMQLANEQGPSANLLYLKNIASRIETEKVNNNIHEPKSIRLLMNVQTVLDGAKDYRHD